MYCNLWTFCAQETSCSSPSSKIKTAELYIAWTILCKINTQYKRNTWLKIVLSHLTAMCEVVSLSRLLCLGLSTLEPVWSHIDLTPWLRCEDAYCPSTSVVSTLRNGLIRKWTTALNFHVISRTPLNVGLVVAVVFSSFSCKKPSKLSSKGTFDESSLNKGTEEAWRSEKVVKIQFYWVNIRLMSFGLLAPYTCSKALVPSALHGP